MRTGVSLLAVSAESALVGMAGVTIKQVTRQIVIHLITFIGPSVSGAVKGGPEPAGKLAQIYNRVKETADSLTALTKAPYFTH